MGRSLWLAAGVAAGVGGTLWAENRVRRKVRQAVDRIAPGHVVGEVVASARDTGERLRRAVDAGRDARTRREVELWSALDEPHPADRRSLRVESRRRGEATASGGCRPAPQ